MTQNIALCSPWEAAKALGPVVVNVAHNIVFPIAQRQDKKNTGGWFVAWRSNGPDVDHAIPQVAFPVGMVDAARFCRYLHFANEKCYRLSHELDNISSWQSRDDTDPNPLLHKYGGAIRCGKMGRLVFAFSGLPEHLDEMLCTVVAFRLELIDGIRAHDIAQASLNAELAAYFRL